jgi:hypothetical protein
MDETADKALEAGVARSKSTATNAISLDKSHTT